jgi:glycosyltransferase involved in cell wall biosynthesis
VRNCRGEYIAFLDDDDEWLPQKLELQVELLERSGPHVGGVYTGFLAVDNSSGELVYQRTPKKRGNVYKDMICENTVGTSSTVGDYIQFDTLGNVGSNIDNNGLTFEFLVKNPVPFSNAAANANRLFGVANDRPGGARKLTLSFGFSDLNLDAVTGNEDSIFLRDENDQAWAYSMNQGGTDMDDGNWHHVAWVVDPGVPINGTHVYVDGSPITLVASNTALFVPKAIGNSGGGNFLNLDKAFTLGAEDIQPGTAGVGLIRTFARNSMVDEFAVYSKALSAQQIALHAAAAGIPEPSSACLLGIALASVAFRRRKSQ